MSTLKLNLTTNDLDLSSDGIELIEGDDEMIQKLVIRFQFFLGEWFLDRRIGIPYFQSVLVKNPNIPFVRSVFRQTILTTPGVADLQNYDLDYDPLTRKLEVDFEAVKDDGAILDFNREFIINV